MKTVVITECGDFNIPAVYQLNLAETKVKGCIGCWNCWWVNPGRCVHNDLDEFYREYVAADKAVFFAKVTLGLVSGNMKSLFDRMIPLFIPYITMKTGVSRHLPRYGRYPEIEFYYEGEFATPGDKALYEGYIRHTFDIFCSDKVTVRPISEFKNAREGAA